MKRYFATLMVYVSMAATVFAARPTILFNAGTGSDTAASGAGPGTALTGAGASLNATTAVDLSANTPNLSGVATDGTAALWVLTSSGRQYARITGVDDGTDIVTVAVAYSVTESGKTWAIGGKRATLDHANSRVLLTTSTGAAPGWTLQIEDDQTITSAIVGATSGDVTDGWITIRGSAENKKITNSANTNHFSSTAANNPTYWKWENLELENSNGTKTNAVGLNMNGGIWAVNQCKLSNATNRLLSGIVRAGTIPSYRITDVEINGCTSHGISATGSGLSIFGRFLNIHGCGGAGITSTASSGTIISIAKSQLWGNTGDGLTIDYSAPGSGVLLEDSTLNANGGDNFDISAALVNNILLQNCNLTDATGYGINAIAAQVYFQAAMNGNNFGAGGLVNTAGARNSVTAGAADQALDPEYVDAATGNFEIGDNLKGLGLPLSSRTIGYSATNSFVDIGAAQIEDVADAADYPAEADVRIATVYANATMTGELDPGDYSADIAAIKTVTDKLGTTFEADGGNFRFTQASVLKVRTEMETENGNLDQLHDLISAGAFTEAALTAVETFLADLNLATAGEVGTVVTETAVDGAVDLGTALKRILAAVFNSQTVTPISGVPITRGGLLELEDSAGGAMATQDTRRDVGRVTDTTP